jgi:hypothetical protein
MDLNAFVRPNFFPEFRLDEPGDEVPDGPAEHEDLLDQVRAEEGELEARHHIQGLHFRRELPVHERHLEFVLEVRYGPQAADDGVGPVLPGELDKQAAEGFDLHLLLVIEDFMDHGQSFFGREQRVLFGIFQDGYQNPVEDFKPPADDVDMAVGNGIKKTRVNSFALHYLTLWQFHIQS